MKSEGEQIWSGIGISPGIAIGPAYVISQSGLTVPEYAIPAAQVEKELKRFQAALAKTKRQLSQLKQKAQSLSSGGNTIGFLLDAYQGMLSGSRLVRGIEDQIEKNRVNAEAAIQRQIAALRASFAKMDDTYLAARGEDVGDVGARLIRNLLEQQYNPFTEAPEGSVIIAEEITPADTALMDPERVAGFATVLGGAEGHSAIMARALGLPAAAGIAELLQDVNAGDLIIIDGHAGEVIARPKESTLRQYKEEHARLQREWRKLKFLKNVPSVTADGTAITLHANLELPREAETAIDAGAAGIGLLRTEFMFMNRPDLPGEDEQFEILKKLAQKLDGKPVTVRTLDVGGEKLATALKDAVGESSNPALGLRAIRLGLKEPKLLEAQLTAILRASAYGPMRILIPMVSSVSQMKQVRGRLMSIERKLQRRGVKLPSSMPPVGAMIEIPGAALAADALARVCDFFAIGSNDLTQYTLAIDRGDDRVADLYEPYHPAVLRLIQFTAAAAWRANIPVSLCGEMAGDPLATPLLLGLGLRELSMAPLRLPLVKQGITQTSLQRAVVFAENIMTQTDESDIRALLQKGPVTEETAEKRKRG